MVGWGRFWVLVGVGLLSSAACGGRTDMGEGYEEPNQGGTNGDPGPGLAGKGQACPGGSCAGSFPGSGATSSYAGGVGIGGSGRAGAPSYAGNPGYGAYPNVGGTGFGVGGSPFAGANTGGYYPYAGGSGIAGFPSAGSYGGPDVCSACLFQTCGAELNQCFQDFGCLSIFSCTQATGCEIFQCYSPYTCGGVIDQWGGPAGYSMQLLLEAFTCAVRSGCPCN